MKQESKLDLKINIFYYIYGDNCVWSRSVSSFSDFYLQDDLTITSDHPPFLLPSSSSLCSQLFLLLSHNNLFTVILFSALPPSLLLSALPLSLSFFLCCSHDNIFFWLRWPGSSLGFPWLLAVLTPDTRAGLDVSHVWTSRLLTFAPWFFQKTRVRITILKVNKCS